MVQVTKGLSYLLHLVPGLYSRIFMLMSTNEELTGLQITQPEVWKRGEVERLAFSEKENEIFGKVFSPLSPVKCDSCRQVFWVLNHEICTFFSHGPRSRGFKIVVESPCVPYLSLYEAVFINPLLFPCHLSLVPHEEKGTDLGPVFPLEDTHPSFLRQQRFAEHICKITDTDNLNILTLLTQLQPMKESHQLTLFSCQNC